MSTTIYNDLARTIANSNLSQMGIVRLARVTGVDAKTVAATTLTLDFDVFGYLL